MKEYIESKKMKFLVLSVYTYTRIRRRIEGGKEKARQKKEREKLRSWCPLEIKRASRAHLTLELE